MRNTEPIFPKPRFTPADTDAVQILVQFGEAQVLHVITCTALDKLRGPEHILGGLVYEMTKAVRQKDPT